MKLRLSKGDALKEFVARLRARARTSRRHVEHGLRQVLEESASPACCAVEKVAHVRSLVASTGGESSGEVAGRGSGEPTTR